ncbi:zinc finger protein 638-like [Myripristis murdjan]|uniref:zinc finger protein 638-like n=1 Tax=Myripristis murdjan TaxID=586833 RepID=UPI0011761E7C|nr:zinc finger protein 638-like [Myripristis murdjan]
MYHHHSQQQGPPQPFSNRPRPTHHQQPPNQQQQSRAPTDMLSQVLGFQFPRPTQLPDELESALAIRGSRDMDHRIMDHISRPNQHQNQGSGPAMGHQVSEHGGYSSGPGTLSADSQLGHQQGMDWSSYQQPSKLFANPPSSASHQPQRHQGPQQQPQNSHSGTNIPSWNVPATDTPSPQTHQPHGSGNGGGNSSGGDGQGLYTPESAGSILASFGLSNEDLEVLSHYPDDQLTPDTLPFILRDIQINKSNNQNNSASTSSFSQGMSHSIPDMPPPPSCASPLRMGRSRSPEVPSLLSVTQTAGKVIDYGHASRTKDDSSGRETFKREPLSSERTVKMVYSPPPSSSTNKHKVEMSERRQVRLEPAESNKHGDLDYRRPSSDIHKTKRSPVGEFPPSSKSRCPDRDYRHDGPKLRPSPKTRSESPSLSRHSSSGSKPHSTTKKLPTPTMISDFSAEPPKVYPHTCSLCHTQCDQEKDWIDHVNTVSHTAACRDLRNKYPDWKPNLPRRSDHSSSRGPWHPKRRSPSRSVSRSLSWSPSPSPPSKYRVPHHAQRHPGRSYPPHHHPRRQHHTEHGRRLELHSSGLHSPTHSHRGSSSSSTHRPERRASESSESSSRSSLKRPRDGSTKRPISTSRHPSSSASKFGQRSKTGTLQFLTKGVTKTGTKSGTKITKTANTKAAASKDSDTSLKPPSAKKKKKVATSSSQSSAVAARLVYLTGIPLDASEQEVNDLVASFGKINNVVLMPGSEDEDEAENGKGQKASVCMVRAEDAQALAQCTSLSIRDQPITASAAKKTEAEKSFDNRSDPIQAKDNSADVEEPVTECDQKTSDEKGIVLITGLPESGWSETDIINLVQPFGTASDIIVAPEVGKVLLSVPDVETAQEMVKVHSFIPAKIQDSELKIIHLKQTISLSTPVALYNLLKGSVDPLETPLPVSWSSLLVISNVPDTPTGPSEVQKLVRRFGNMQKCLVLNKNMIICEMATAAVALSVYKRFQKFPCIIQNNPLYFSRKADPKLNTQNKIIVAYLDSSKDSPSNGKESQTTAATDKEESEHQEIADSALEKNEKENDEKYGEKMEGDETISGENEVVREEQSKDGDDEVKKEQPAGEVSDPTAATDTKPEITNEKLRNNKTPSDKEEIKASSFDGAEAANSELPKVTQEMVDALLEECRTRTADPPGQTATSPRTEQEEAKMEIADGDEGESEGTAPEKKELVKNNKEEEKRKKQERERKEREVKREKEARERERKEKERRVWERREEERREWERRERERKERRRTYREGSSGSRSSGRSDANRRSSGKDGQITVAEKAKKEMEEEEEEFDFPFDMGDFVTVDEVGDVADLTSSPPPSVHMDATGKEEEEGTSTPVQQDTPETPPTAGTAAEASVDAMPAPDKVDAPGSEPEPKPQPEPESEAQPATDLENSASSPALTSAASPSAAPQTASPSSQAVTPAPPPEPESTPETVTAPTVTLDFTPEVDSIPVPAPITTASSPIADLVPSSEAASSAESPSAGAVKAEEGNGEENKTSSVNHSQAEMEEMAVAVVSEKTTEVKMQDEEEEKKLQDEGGKDKELQSEDKEKSVPVAGTEKHERCEDEKDEECVKKKLKTESSSCEAYALPPFDPNNPVGMEFLVPKTGFFCKVCNRFFSGSQEAEISHCKGLKHYENLQKYLQSRKTAKPVSC